jgi:hypothetical protein
LNIRPHSVSECERYQAEWSAIQAKFVDQPGQATVEADHLIQEVMKVCAYPVSDFEQRAADILVNYLALVRNYRLAREIALKKLTQAVTTYLLGTLKSLGKRKPGQKGLQQSIT